MGFFDLYHMSENRRIDDSTCFNELNVERAVLLYNEWNFRGSRRNFFFVWRYCGDLPVRHSHFHSDCLISKFWSFRRTQSTVRNIFETVLNNEMGVVQDEVWVKTFGT